uniref:Uncharacterized protein n=1 Tax=uncultured marine Nitrospinaceae bacterium TaxID=482920 RepID=A4GIZ3_9BACT|nr:hypothetical protein [uncultured marine Nitrospinaceae bacterium]
MSLTGEGESINETTGEEYYLKKNVLKYFKARVGSSNYVRLDF